MILEGIQKFHNKLQNRKLLIIISIKSIFHEIYKAAANTSRLLSVVHKSHSLMSEYIISHYLKLLLVMLCCKNQYVFMILFLVSMFSRY